MIAASLRVDPCILQDKKLSDYYNTPKDLLAAIKETFQYSAEDILQQIIRDRLCNP